MATKVTGDQYYDLDGQLLEIKRQLRQQSGYPFNPEVLKLHLQAAIEGRFVQAAKMQISRIISDQPLAIDAVDGTEILADANDVFTHIDPDLRNWGADEPGQPTAETPVVMREMCDDATFAQMFGELSSDVSKLCLTQHQIKNFARKRRQWLRTDGYAILFLFKSKDHFFVADVSVDSGDGLSVNVLRFEGSNVWDAEGRRRLVVPQL